MTNASAPRKSDGSLASAGVWTRITNAWNGYFFTPQAPTDLAVGRLLGFGLLFLYYLPIDFAGWAEVTPAAWLPLPIFEWFRLPVLPYGVLATISLIWKLSLLLACVGLFTRISTGVAFVLGFYLLALPHNFGKVNHYDAIAVFTLAILAFSRCGDALSLDAKFFRKTPAVASGEYRWPVRCIWVVFAVIFFSAGVSKLTASGLAWVTSDHMATVLVKEQYNSFPLVSWGAWIARHPPLPNLMAAATLVLELGYPLALFSRRARLLFVPGMFFAQVGIRVLMGPAFWPFLILNVFWVPWGYLLETWRSKSISRAARASQT